MNMDHIGIVDDLLDQRRRNEVQALGIPEHEIAGHDRRFADAYRNVDAADDYVRYCARMNVTEIRRHIHSRNAIQVSNGAIDDQAGGLRSFHEVVEKVVAYNCAAFLLPEQVDDQHVAWLQHVYRDLVVHTGQSRCLRLRVDHAIEIGTKRHELHGEG